MVVLYGIPTCDTVRKARRWLEAQGVAYRFHDFRKDGLTPEQLEAWTAELGWEQLLNRRGTTWRKLPEELRTGIDRAGAVRLMLEHPAIIKRPLLDLGARRVPGFTPDLYTELFG